MEKPRGTRTEEVERVVELINRIFRIDQGHEPTIQQEFPLLLTKSNAENMRIIEKDNKPVSCVNFVESNILIQGAEISVASVGGVCTEKEYRGRGYSSLILDDVENKMLQDGVDLALVSGTRALYQRRGYTLTRNFIRFDIKGEECKLNFDLKEFRGEDLIEIMKLYNTSSTRFKRTEEEFKKLIKAALFPWGNITYKSYIIEENKVIVGYIFVKIVNNEEKSGRVVEAFGNNDYIAKALKYIAFENQMENIEYRVHINDKRNFLNTSYDSSIDYQEGSVKIINFEKFMESLKPYFSQYVDAELLDKIQFEARSKKGINGVNTEELNIEEVNEKDSNEKYIDNEDRYAEDLKKKSTNKTKISYCPRMENKTGTIEFDGFKLNVSEDILNHIDTINNDSVYTFICGDEILEIEDVRTLNKLVFEGKDSLNINLTDKENLETFIDRVFPIPFIYVGNLNYQ